MPASSILKSTAAWAPLVIRVAVGIIFMAHGAQKLFGAFGGSGLEGFAQGLAGMGVQPAILWAWIVALAEFLGGIALVLGLLTGLASVALAVNMIVAVALVHWKSGFFLPGGFEFNLALIAMLVSLLLSGPGACSVDKLIRWRF